MTKPRSSAVQILIFPFGSRNKEEDYLSILFKECANILFYPRCFCVRLAPSCSELLGWPSHVKALGPGEHGKWWCMCFGNAPGGQASGHLIIWRRNLALLLDPFGSICCTSALCPFAVAGADFFFFFCLNVAAWIPRLRGIANELNCSNFSPNAHCVPHFTSVRALTQYIVYSSVFSLARFGILVSRQSVGWLACICLEGGGVESMRASSTAGLQASHPPFGWLAWNKSDFPSSTACSWSTNTNLYNVSPDH